MTRPPDGPPSPPPPRRQARPVLPALAAGVPPSAQGTGSRPDPGPGPAEPAGLPSAATATALPPGDEPEAQGPDGAAPPAQAPARKRTDPWKAGFFVLAAVAIVAGVAWALLGSKFLVVRSITINGAPDIPRSQVIAAAGVRAGTPLIRVSSGKVARRVERLTLVESARVTRSWPDAITITIKERTAVFAVRDGSGYDLADRFGVVLHHVARRPHGMPLLLTTTAPDRLRGNPALFAAATVDRELPAKLAAKVRSIAAPTASTVTLYLRHGRTVQWGDASQTAEKARELAILMRGHARYFDVSDPRAVVTGPSAPPG